MPSGLCLCIPTWILKFLRWPFIEAIFISSAIPGENSWKYHPKNPLRRWKWRLCKHSWKNLWDSLQALNYRRNIIILFWIFFGKIILRIYSGVFGKNSWWNCWENFWRTPQYNITNFGVMEGAFREEISAGLIWRIREIRCLVDIF